MRRRFGPAVAVVVAHPDDETIGAGASLGLFDDLLLVHVTDGAPRSLQDARAAGFEDAAGYAAARRRELAAALREGGVAPRLACLERPDQQASIDMRESAGRLAALLEAYGSVAVLTHAYEGGHPDHDATACIVQAAAALLARPPTVIEMHGYHASGDGMRTGCFLGDGGIEVALDAAERETKRRMLACFVSQQRTLAAFGVALEGFRAALGYDFGEPPHAGALHYERYDWGMTGAHFREHARAMR